MIKLPEDLESKYRFVTLASLRAEQLLSGARARIESKHIKAMVIAQEEVAAGTVNLWNPEEVPEGEEAPEGAEEE